MDNMCNRSACYRVIYEHQYGARQGFKILYDPNSVWPWCVERHGNGHYGMTAREVLQFANGRGWINFGERETIAKKIEMLFKMKRKPDDQTEDIQ